MTSNQMPNALFFLVFLTSVLFSCAGENNKTEQQGSSLDVIVGENDLMFYTKADDISAAIGIMEVGCTASHIGDGFVITAGHCLSKGVDTCGLPESDITWSFLEGADPEESLKSKCVSVVAAEFTSERDYAVLQYEPAPKSRLAVNLDKAPELGDEISIFSHPNGLPLSWSGVCTHDGEYKGLRFSYGCDTFSGSSGAAILDKDFRVVGIHNMGSDFYQTNAGTYLLEIPVFQQAAKSAQQEGSSLVKSQ